MATFAVVIAMIAIPVLGCPLAAGVLTFAVGGSDEGGGRRRI
jgi:hypothetical protein